MTETSSKPKPRIDAGAALRLWIGMLLPPAAWLAELQTLYLTSEFGCTTSNFTRNHIVAAVAIVVSLAGWAIAWREWTKSRDADPSDNVDTRHRFMALIGVLTGALFTLLILALWLPTLMGVPCDK